MAEPQQQLQVSGIWTKDTIDIYTIGELERIRSNYTMSLTDATDIKEATRQFLVITSKMQEVIEKLFEHDNYKAIKEWKIPLYEGSKELYNWYQLREGYDFFIDDMDELRFLYEALSRIYGHFLKKAKIGIETGVFDPKKN